MDEHLRNLAVASDESIENEQAKNQIENMVENVENLAVASRKLIDNESAKPEDVEELVVHALEGNFCNLSKALIVHNDVFYPEADIDKVFPSSSKEFVQMRNFHDSLFISKVPYLVDSFVPTLFFLRFVPTKRLRKTNHCRFWVLGTITLFMRCHLSNT